MYRKIHLIKGLLFLMVALLPLLTLAHCKPALQRANYASGPMQDSIELLTAYPAPIIPMTLQNSDDKALYFVNHFWDNWNFSDTTLLQHPERIRQSIENFLGVATNLPIKEVTPALIAPLKAVGEKALFDFFLTHYEKYLYEPDSPFFSETYYYPIVNWVANSTKANIAQVERAKFRKKLLQKNRVGFEAEPFVFTQPDGSRTSLKNLRGKSVLLFFLTPGCDQCTQAIKELEENSFLRKMVATQKLQVLFIDAENDAQEWALYLDKLPDFGIKGFNHDGRIISIPLYDLKTTPALYFIDDEGIIRLKNTTVGAVAQQLKTMFP